MSNPTTNLNSLKLKVKQLEQQNKILQQLLQSFPHETRAPIASVTGYTNLLLTETCGPLNEKQKEFAEQILNIAQRLRLININTQDIVYALYPENTQLEKVNLKQFLYELDDIQIDHVEIDHSLEIWIYQRWLSSMLQLLFSIPSDNYISKRSVFCTATNKTQYLILQIKHNLKRKATVSRNDLRLQCLQISIEQQGRFINWHQLAENELEFELGIPNHQPPLNAE